MYRSAVVWERPDGLRFEEVFLPRLSKNAANDDATEALRHQGSNRFVSRRVEKTHLSWYTVEVDGKTV